MGFNKKRKISYAAKKFIYIDGNNRRYGPYPVATPSKFFFELELSVEPVSTEKGGRRPTLSIMRPNTPILRVAINPDELIFWSGDMKQRPVYCYAEHYRFPIEVLALHIAELRPVETYTSHGVELEWYVNVPNPWRNRELYLNKHELGKLGKLFCIDTRQELIKFRTESKKWFVRRLKALKLNNREKHQPKRRHSGSKGERRNAYRR